MLTEICKQMRSPKILSVGINTTDDSRCVLNNRTSKPVFHFRQTHIDKYVLSLENEDILMWRTVTRNKDYRLHRLSQCGHSPFLEKETSPDFYQTIYEIINRQYIEGNK